MRTLFESWAMRHLLSLMLNDNGEYANATTQLAWWAWQAAWDNALLTFETPDKDCEEHLAYPSTVDSRGSYAL